MSRTNRRPEFNTTRRRLLQKGLVASGVLAIGPVLWNSATTGSSLRAANATAINGRRSNIPNLAGTLHEINVDNDPATRMLVPRGFSVREVARTGQAPFAGSSYVWHAEPDGGAVFAMDDGGWVYVSNAEIDKPGQGGVGALRFNAAGEIIDSYSICSGTTNNCAGGPTPWGTWLSCEEIDAGLVYECDPSGKTPAVVFPALGAFKHEAAAVDPVGKHIYLTEDTADGNFYRFIPNHYPDNGRADLSSGRLEVAVVAGTDPLQSRSIRWVEVSNPVPNLASETPTRKQVAQAEKFNGGEGCWYHNGIVYFTTKGDNRVWAVDTAHNIIDLVYDKKRDSGFSPDMNDVDNITVSSAGDIIVAEDGAEMRLVVVGTGIKPFELVNVQGHRGSEITGPDFSPDGSRLYFSSQNGISGDSTDGRTYEMRGPFFV
jgi:secreted PhoX family phosphatase